MPLKRLFAAAALAGAAFVAAAMGSLGAAQAQPACAEDDLRCRVTALEARVDDLINRLERPNATGATSTPLATMFNLRRACGANCAAEAIAECNERGFASGRPEDWERPRTGPVILTRITCTR